MKYVGYSEIKLSVSDARAEIKKTAVTLLVWNEAKSSVSLQPLVIQKCNELSLDDYIRFSLPFVQEACDAMSGAANRSRVSTSRSLLCSRRR